eukprot:868361_1
MSAVVHSPSTVKRTILGSLLVACSQLAAVTAETIVKRSKLTVIQILTGREVVHLIISILWWNIKKPVNVKHWYGDKPHRVNIWTRGFLLSLLGALLYYGVITLPLGDLQCIFYLSPLIAVFLASLGLSESLPNLFILIPSILLTVCGVILVCQPTFIMNIIHT